MRLGYLHFFTLIIFHTFCFGQASVDKIIGKGTGNSIVQSGDSNLIICGDRDGRLLVSKIDSSGNEIWTNLFGLTTGSSPNNSGYNLIKVEKNYLITGRYDPGIGAYNKAYAVMVNESGNLIWENNYGNNNSYSKYSCYDSLSKVIYITGSIKNSSFDIFLIKIDTSGNTIWENSYDFGSSEIGESISLLDPSNIFVAGNTTSGSANNMFNGFLLQIDSSGLMNLQKTFGGSQQDNIYDFKILPDGGSLLVGSSNSYSVGNSDAWIVRLNALGDTLWTTTVGGPFSEASYSLFIDDPSKIWICGKTNLGAPYLDQGWLFEIDSAGILLNTINFGGVKNESLYGLTILNRNIYSIGTSTVNLNDSIYFVRTDSLTLGLSSKAEINFTHSIFPNPTESFFYFKFGQPISLSSINFSIYDWNGIEYECPVEKEDQLIKIELPELKGLYILSFRISNINYTYKIIKY